MLLDQHRAKLVEAEYLAALFDGMPRAKKVVLCHGVFDVVHPGHLRHLLYAKSKGDYLIASVTSDRHITKGTYRPHVPEELRAGNLAMLDFVDYVLVTNEEKPLKLIELLQPNYYAKGFEYSSTVRLGGDIEEAGIVEAYGGELLFTPGDIIYSSSTLIDAQPPDLRYEKLWNTMQQHKITFDMLRSVMDAMKHCEAHVVGDVIVDALLNCAMIGGQIKTPTLSVKRGRCDTFVGGAGVVAKHIKAAGATVSIATVVGDDNDGRFVLDDLDSAGVEVIPIVDVTRPTTRKEAIVVGTQRLLKVDTVDNRSISDPDLRRLCETVREVRMGAVVYSDFRHGIFNARTIPWFLNALPLSPVKCVADSQVATRWGNITEFKGFNLITPNEREARFALADQDSGVRPLASKLYDEAECDILMMKMGERGMITCVSSDHKAKDSFFVVDSFATSVVDPVGAGDALLAYATLATLVDGDPCMASILGAFAAGCACECNGNVPIQPEYVYSKIEQAEKEI